MAAVQELNDVRQEGQDMTCSDEELPPCDTFANSDSVTAESRAIKVIHCEYKEKYVIEFKRDYYLCGKHNLEVQVRHLARLADYYTHRYNTSRNWIDCLKAHALYNSIISRAPSSPHWPKRLFEIQEHYYNEKSGNKTTLEKQIEIKENLSTKLKEVRERYKSRMAQTAPILLKSDQTLDVHSQGEFTASIRAISQECTFDMIHFAKEIIQYSLDTLQEPPPCDFSVLAIGSMARGEATPYSDLEYLFLIDERSESIVQYFERLAMSTYFLIGNLGETTLDYMDIVELRGWFKDCAKRGFKIDGLEEKAGNIPTGNGRPESINHFIAIPEELAATYTQVLRNPEEDKALRGDFTAMLTYTTVIYKHGKAALRDQFISCMRQVTIPNQRRLINIEMLKKDTAKFNFDPDVRVHNKGFTIDVKKELYRFPSILLLDLAIVFNTVGTTAWETIHLLQSKGFISDCLHESLSFILACACYIRLSAYLHYDSHNDSISVAPKNKIDLQTTEYPMLPQHERWFTPFNLYIQLCQVSAPIKRQITSLLSSSDGSLPKLMEIKADLNWSWTFQAMFSTGRHKEALELLMTQLGDNEDNLKPQLVITLFPPDWTKAKALFVAGQVLAGCAKYDLALKFAELSDEIDNSEKNKVILSKLYCNLSEYQKAHDVLLTVEHKSAEAHMHLGGVYVDLGFDDMAEAEILTALQMFHDEACNETIYDYTEIW